MARGGKGPDAGGNAAGMQRLFEAVSAGDLDGVKVWLFVYELAYVRRVVTNGNSVRCIRENCTIHTLFLTSHTPASIAIASTSTQPKRASAPAPPRTHWQSRARTARILHTVVTLTSTPL